MSLSLCVREGLNLFHLSRSEINFYYDNREVTNKHDVNSRRQTAKITSDFVFFSFNL